MSASRTYGDGLGFGHGGHHAHAYLVQFHGPGSCELSHRLVGYFSGRVQRDTAVQYVQVFPPVSAQFAAPTEGCSPFTVQLSDRDGGHAMALDHG